MSQDTEVRFDGQEFQIGIDKHRSSWVVTIRSSGLELKTLSMSADAKALYAYMSRQYPGGVYYSAYEAGFSGFGAHRELQSLGINNKVVHPADVPSMEKDRRYKSDQGDSRRLSKGLENRTLEGIYVPDAASEQLRGVVRMRQSLSRDQTRLKNRIKSLLYIEGLGSVIQQYGSSWSSRFMEQLGRQQLAEASSRTLQTWLEQLLQNRRAQHQTLRWLREYVKQRPSMARDIELLQSVPGLGFVGSITFYGELMGIERFKRYEHLCAYVGLRPTSRGSGERQRAAELTPRCNNRMRRILIEASWVAVRTDPAMLAAYKRYCVRMKPQMAIIRIARKLLRRIRMVLLQQQPYQKSVA